MFLFLQRKEKWSDVVHCSVQQHTQFSDKVKVFFFPYLHESKNVSQIAHYCPAETMKKIRSVPHRYTHV